MKFLLLGATGVVGTAVEQVCQDRGLSWSSPGHQEFDLRDHLGLPNLLDRHQPQVVVNCVAIPSIDPCEQDPALALDLHALAVLTLARECARRQITLVQPSSHAVFDGLKEGPYLENDQVKATNIYSATKLLSERLAAAYCHRHYIVRFPTLFGPRRNTSLGFVDKVLTWIRAGRELKIADDRMDSPTYSRDAAAAVVNLVMDRAPYGLYHVANQGWVSYYDFVAAIIKHLGATNALHRAKDADFPSLTYKPLRTALASLHLAPLRPWSEALADYLDQQ